MSVQDDPVAMLELALSFERCRTKILRKKYNKALKDASLAPVELPAPAEFGPAIEAELTSSNLVAFAEKTDLVYKDA